MTAQTGSVTLIQHFGSALNLNVHFHMLFLDGVYAEDDYGKQRFHRAKAPTHEELNTLVHTLSHRITRCLEKRGILERDAENTRLTLEEGEDDALNCMVHRLPTALPPVPNRGAKSSPCKPCQDERIRPMLAIAWPTMPASRYTPV